MITRVLPVLVGLLGVCLPVLADETGQLGRGGREVIAQESLDLDRHDLFTTVEGSLLLHSLPVLARLDGERLPVASELGRMGRTSPDLGSLAFLSPVPKQSTEIAPIDGKDATGEILSLRDRLYTSGEVGFLYGTSTGKHGGDFLAGYVTGTIGNVKFQLTVGASYEESSLRAPRYYRYR